MFCRALVVAFAVVIWPPGSNGECPDGFVKHNGTCYHFSHDTETWIDAMEICEKLYDAKLVEVDEQNENNFLINESKILNGEYWTGGNDLQIEGEWHWVTSGDPITTITFSGNGPSNSNGDENCLEILTGSWNDDVCHKPQKYICEKPSEELEIVG